jgi:hypothetical protein
LRIVATCSFYDHKLCVSSLNAWSSEKLWSLITTKTLKIFTTSTRLHWNLRGLLQGRFIQ